MSEVIPELLHADSLNIAKLLFKHLLMRHATLEARKRLSRFFLGLGHPIDVRKKEGGRVKADKWFRASAWDALVQGTNSLPAEFSVWLPTACFILIDIRQDMRGRQRNAAMAAAAR
eukprot:6211845-Pleurochrysis_carterae.AAC.3